MVMKKILYGLALLFAFFIGFTLGRSGIETPLNTTIDTIRDVASESVTAIQTEVVSSSTPSSTDAPKPATSVGASMTASQRKMLESFGLDPDKITITQATITCAEGKLGAARIAEITNGATPSLMEGASLVACYK